jgi:hypothetical protein
MHRCLGIRELLDYILEFTDDQSTLLNLALTCQGFSEAAIDILWGIHGDLASWLQAIPGLCVELVSKSAGTEMLVRPFI